MRIVTMMAFYERTGRLIGRVWRWLVAWVRETEKRGDS